MSSIGVLLVALGATIIVTLFWQGLTPKDAQTEVKGLLHL